MNEQLVKGLRLAAERAEAFAEVATSPRRDYYLETAELHRRAANALEAI